jgi:hypothetical protein
MPRNEGEIIGLVFDHLLVECWIYPLGQRMV